MGSVTNPKRDHPIQALDSPFERQRLESSLLQESFQHTLGTPKDVRLCGDCQKIHLDRDLETSVCGTIRTQSICSLEHVSATNMCDLCDVFIAMINKNEKGTPWLLAASPKGAFTSSGPKVPDSGVMLFVRPKGSPFCFGSQFLIMVDDRAKGISGRNFLKEIVSYAAIKQLLLYCQDHHTVCAATNVPIELQVIDCQSGQMISVEAGTSSYIALSYVWGSIGSEMQEPNESLWTIAPRTIRDAMTLALRLDIPYLWVDRYCIPQDDGHKKQFLISRMGLIYSQATLTVVAAAGTDPSYGLPGVTSTPRKHQPSVKLDSKTFTISSNVRHEIENSKWNSRGWTYQEAMLSRRRLIFTDSQFYFQCCAMHCTEAISMPLQSLHISSGERFPKRLNIWKVFPDGGIGHDPLSSLARIEEFARREFTLDSDVLNAFQGIIQEFKKSVRPVHFISGIPVVPTQYFVRTRQQKAQLTFGLTWRYLPRGNLYRRYCFPSWSWLDWRVDKPDPRETIHFFGLRPTQSAHAKRILGFFKNHVDIGVELPDGTIIPWVGYRAFIESKFEEGTIPNYLHIKGWTFDLEIVRDAPDAAWKVNWPGVPQYKVNHDPKLVNGVDLSFVAADQLCTTLKVLMLCSTVNRRGVTPSRVGLFIRYSDRIKAYERIGICDLCRITVSIRGAPSWVDVHTPTIEAKSSTYATLGPFHLIKREIRLG